MSKTVNVDFTTRVIEIETDGKEHFISAALAAKNANADAQTAKKAAEDALQIVDNLQITGESTAQAKKSAEVALTSEKNAKASEEAVTVKAEDVTSKHDDVVTKHSDVMTKAEQVTTDADNAKNAADTADGIATQLTEYLKTKENLTAPAVDKSLLIEGAAADSKTVGERVNKNTEDIDMLTAVTTLINLFDVSKTKEGYFNENGNVSADSTSLYSPEFISVKPNTPYAYTTTTNTLVIATYDESKQFIARVNQARGSSKVTFADNIRYIRLSFYRMKDLSAFMFCETSLPDSFIPYSYFLKKDRIKGIDAAIDATIDAAIDATIDVLGNNTSVHMTPDSTWDKIWTDYYSAPTLTPLTNYMSYGVLLKRDAKVWFPVPSTMYCSVAVFSDDTLTRGTLYRDTTLPTTKDTAITCKAKQYIIVSCRIEYNNFNLELDDYGVKLKDYISLSDNQLSKKWYLKYTQKNPSTLSKGKIELYIPNNTNYLKFLLQESYCDSQTTSNSYNPTGSSNSNVWRISKAYACDENLSEKFAITIGGEWECAIQLADLTVSDFMGGVAHGDEAKESVVFFVNGRVVNIEDYTELTAIDSFSFVQTSSLYNPDDKATLSTRNQFEPVATHGSQHIFTANGVKIEQNVLWHKDVKVRYGHLCMMLNSKDIVDKMFTDANCEQIDLSNKSSYQLINRKVNKVTQYSDDTGRGVKASVTVDRKLGANSEGLDGYVMIGDNGGGSYHKCYLPLFVNPNGEAVAKGTIWKCDSKYEFEIGE